LPRSEVIAFFTNSIFDATSGSFADRARKCLVNAAKTARKPPKRVAKMTILVLSGFDLISGMVGGLRSWMTTGSWDSLIFAVSYCLRSIVPRLSLNLYSRMHMPHQIEHFDRVS
jgi:hypothetical protein